MYVRHVIIHGVGSGMCVCTMVISHVLLIFLFHCCHVHAVSPIAALYTGPGFNPQLGPDFSGLTMTQLM